jgi:hypothetical protein
MQNNFSKPVKARFSKKKLPLGCHSGESRNPGSFQNQEKLWTPAFAGVTL